MKSKAEIIRDNLAGLRVLDIGGTGYKQSNAYEYELSKVWSLCKARTTVDCNPDADIIVNFNSSSFPPIIGNYDIATAFDVLEHLERPVDVLRWIPTKKLIVTLPNALSCITRRMEESNKFEHLYSFTPYTASVMLKQGGWRVIKIEYQFGKWSPAAKCMNLIGSLCPSFAGTGIVIYCERQNGS